MKKLLAAVILVLGFTSAAQAGIMIEPYLGFEMGKTKSPDGKLEGTQLGLRLAYSAPIFFWAGLDATLGVSAKNKPDGAAESAATRSTYHAVVGVDFPILVRAWAGYGLMNDIKVDTGTYKGKSTKLGVGFTGLPFLSLNVEMISETFDKLDSTTLASEFKNDTYVLSVSLPLDF